MLFEGLGFTKIDNIYDYISNGKIFAKLHNYLHSFSSLGLCRFVVQRMNALAWPEFLKVITGKVYTLEDLEWIGGRIAIYRQMFNIREGVNCDKIQIPKRLFGCPPLDDGPLKGISVNIKPFLEEYYKNQGWDPETGIPTVERLKEVGLENLIFDLHHLLRK